MQFSEIATADNPLEALVQMALTFKGITVTKGTINRYSSLLEAALLADEGQSLEGNVWADFVGGIEGDRFEECCNAIGQTIGASSSEITEFLAIANATGDVLAGKEIELAEDELFAELESIMPTEADAYTHLDEQSKTAAIEVESARATSNDPDHRASDEGGYSDEE